MKCIVISGNPKKDGLCDSVVKEILKGAKDGGAQVELINADNTGRCRVCGDGWGICKQDNVCAFGDDGFSGIQQKLSDADCFCIITPVYWGEMSEGLKSLLDRIRRCEFGQNGKLSGKPILLVASPGGSGNGMLTCLEQMDRFCRHTSSVIFDYIGINRWNNDYKKNCAYEASKAMASGRKAAESL